MLRFYDYDIDPQRQPIIADYPAYSIHKPQGQFSIWPFHRLRANQDIMVHVRGMWRKFAPGSVASSCIAHDNDPLKGIERAKRLGHKLKWINGCSVCLTSWKQPKEHYFGFEYGDKVWFEGEVFELVPESNDNVGLRLVEEAEAENVSD